MINKIYYIDGTLIEFDKIFEERSKYVRLFNLRHVIRIPSFRMVNLLCCGGHFSNVALIDTKAKFRSPYLLDVSQPYL